MKTLKRIVLDDGTSLLVAVREIEVAETIAVDEIEAANSMPNNSEQTSAKSRMERAGKLLREQIKGLHSIVRDARGDLQPDEIKLKAGVGFTGKVELIPFITSTEGEASLELEFTWKNNVENA